MLKKILCAVVAAVVLLPSANGYAKGFHIGHALLGGVIGYELGKAMAHSEPSQVTSEGSNRATAQPAPMPQAVAPIALPQPPIPTPTSNQLCEVTPAPSPPELHSMVAGFLAILMFACVCLLIFIIVA